jgi:hypothetical protein
MKTLATLISVVLTAANLYAIPLTFDVNRADFGVGSFTIDLPATWAGIAWQSVHGEQFFVSTSSEGTYTSVSASPDIFPNVQVPWRLVQVGFGDPGVPPPLLDNASLFMFTDRIPPIPGVSMGWDGSNLRTPRGELAATPIEAIDALFGVSVHTVSASVPETGSTLLLLSGAFGFLLIGRKALNL